jgi:hypothetical protein
MTVAAAVAAPGMRWAAVADSYRDLANRLIKAGVSA